jgi:hypothetical protein
VAVSDGSSWTRALRTTERFDLGLADELLRLVATRTHYTTGYGTVTFRSGRREATVSARSITITGNQVTITESAASLDDPEAFLQRVRDVIGERELVAGSAGYFLAGLPLFDRTTQASTRGIAKQFPGVDIVGGPNLLNWLILLPSRTVGDAALRYVDRLEGMLSLSVIQEKLPALVDQIAAVRAADPSRPYRDALEALPLGMRLYDLPGGIIVRTSDQAIAADPERRIEQLAPLKAAWQWLETLPFYKISSGSFVMWIAAENVRDWFYRSAESAEEASRWQKEQQDYFDRLKSGNQSVLSDEEFDEEFGD